MIHQETIIIVGAGQSGLAVAACLAAQSIPSLILERDHCIASMWRNRSYDRLSLHLAKQFSQLPLTPHSPQTPLFMHKSHYIRYLDDYAQRHKLRIQFDRRVRSAQYDERVGRWRVEAVSGPTGAVEEFWARYLVVASGPNDEKFVPEIEGLDRFVGPVVHSSEFRSGSGYEGKAVLVVGGGNSGLEIAYDLADHAARTSLVVRNKLHIVSKEIWLFGMFARRFLPVLLVDKIMLFLCYLKYGNLAKYGLHRHEKGPLYLKLNTPIFPVIDIGAVSKIKSGEIQILPSIKNIKGNSVGTSDGKVLHFDAIVLATGYRSTVKKWLKGGDDLFGDDGRAKQSYPNHWKGKNGLYSAGFGRRGIYGCGEDAQSIAKDIAVDLTTP